VVHSLWPFNQPGEIRGWRNAPARSRLQKDRPVEWTSLHEGELRNLLTTLVELVARCRRLEQWVTPPVP
jgi:hypothetical protein